jgi:hypothetical protein
MFAVHVTTDERHSLDLSIDSIKTPYWTASATGARVVVEAIGVNKIMNDLTVVVSMITAPAFFLLAWALLLEFNDWEIKCQIVRAEREIETTLLELRN